MRDVVHRGDGEDEGAAGVGDVGDELGFDRNKAVVHAGDDDRRVEAAEDGAAQDAGGVVQPLDGIGEGDTGVARRRPDDGKGEQRGDEDGQERRQQQIDACRDDAAQAAFQFGEYPATDEDGQHRTLVADFGDAEAKNIPVLQRAVGGRLREGIVVGEVGVHHDHAEHRAEVGVAAENAGGREGDEDGEEDEGRVGEGIDHLRQSCPLRVGLYQRFALDDEVMRGEDVVQPHQQTAGDDGGDDGDEDVGKGFDEALHQVAFRRAEVFGFLGADLFDAGDVKQLSGNFIDRAGAEDDLELPGGEEIALGERDGINGGLVDFALVFQDHAQAGGAVRRGGDVVAAADGGDDGFSGLAVFTHGGSPLGIVAGGRGRACC